MAAISRQKAVTFCQNVLKMKEKTIGKIKPSVFCNEYAEKFTKRVPFTSVFDNYVLRSKGHNWNSLKNDPSLLKAPGASWFNGMLEGKFGSSCQVAATFSKLILESLGLKSRIIISRVHLFPVTIIHSLVITEDEEGDLSIIDLGNRLTPLPLSIPLKMAVNEKSEVFEAGDTYTYMIRTGEHSYERWIGYELNSDGSIKDAVLFNDFTLDDTYDFYDSHLVAKIMQWEIPIDVILNYWTYNVPISGFSEHDARIVRVTNRKFSVQTEPKIGAPFESFKVESFDEYCKNVFQFFPRFENEQFVAEMSNFWKMKYS